MIVLKSHVFRLLVTRNEDGVTFNREATADHCLYELQQDDYLREGSADDDGIVAITTLSSFYTFVQTYWIAKSLLSLLFTALSVGSFWHTVPLVIKGRFGLQEIAGLAICIVAMILSFKVSPSKFTPVVLDKRGALVDLVTGYTTLNNGCYIRR